MDTIYQFGNYPIQNILYLLTIFFVFYILFILYYHFPDNFDKTVITSKNTTAYVINLDKNKERLQRIYESYNASDIKEIELKRFPAILGKNVNINDWLSPEAIKDLEFVEKKGYRLYHYQLTRGGIGCFLSHYTLAKQLLTDKRNDYYIIMEDDSNINKDGFKQIQEALVNVPENWDIVLFGFIRIIRPTYMNNFIKPAGFWGTHGYLINKQGAKKLVEETDALKIDGQVDAFISRMIQQNKINVYAYKKHLFYQVGRTSDIQSGIKLREDINPFNYRGYIV
jgi:GR25 family glycosyltransferase involved in LPS biosynthesis